MVSDSRNILREKNKAESDRILDVLITLRAINDPKTRVRQIALCAKHALHDEGVISLARKEIERALPRDCAERRAAFAELSQPKPAFFPAPALIEDRTEAFRLLADPELMRVFIALGYGIPVILWAAAQTLNRRDGGAGWVKIDELISALKEEGVRVKERTIRRHWLDKGKGIFWRQVNMRLYLVGYHKLCENAVRFAYDAGKNELVSTNPPGARFVEIPLGKTLVECYGHTLAAWHNSRGERTQNISRFVLERLWGTTRKTLLKWEKAARIEVSKCYALYFDDEHIPVKHAYPTLHRVRQLDGAVKFEVRATARHSNIYHAPVMKERQHKRTPREARRKSRRTLELLTLSGIRTGIYGQPEAKFADGGAIRPTKRRNFHANDGDRLAAFKRLHRHVRNHDEIAAHYVPVSHDEKRDIWWFEQSSDGIHRSAPNDRVPRIHEDAYFAQQGGRGSYVAAWREMAI